MRKFLYFLSSDADLLRRRLERLTARGWELTETDGLFTGQFEPTSSTDLRWLVVPCGGQKNFPRQEDCEPFGWELVGGFNGMAIFKALPVSVPDEAGLTKRLEEDGCIRRDRLTVPLMALVLVLIAVLLCVPSATGWFRTPFWRSYQGIALRFLRLSIVVLAAANLAALPRSSFSAWVHGLTLPACLGVVFLSLLTAHLDESASQGYFVILPLLLGAACLLALWRRCRPLGWVMAGICLVVLCLGLLFPNADMATISAGRALRGAVSDQCVLTLADMGQNEAPTGVGYTKDGTFLARRTSYWEMSESAGVSSEVYCCLTAGLARSAEAELMSAGTWTETDFGWCNADGSTVVIRDGRVAAKLSCSCGFETTSATAAFAALFF